MIRAFWDLKRTGEIKVSDASIRSKMDTLVVKAADYLSADTGGLMVNGGGMADRSHQRKASPLQNYLLSRVDGVPGPKWLDTQSIEQGQRATEMLGVVLEFGPKPNLNALSADNWDLAGRTGFSFTSQGETGVRLALTEILNSSSASKGDAGPQQHFGRIYQWLEFAKSDKDPGPIRSIVRAHILDQFEIEAGKSLFGEPVEKRYLHSVTSLARQEGVNQMTLHNLLISKGVLDKDSGRSGWRHTFSASVGETVADAMKHAMPVVQLPKALNCTRAQATQFLSAGLLRTIADDDCETSGRFARAVDMREVTAFLAEIDDLSQPTERPPTWFVQIPKAAEIVKTKSSVILKLFLEGKLPGTRKLKSVAGYKGLLVDPDEIRPRLEGPSKVGI